MLRTQSTTFKLYSRAFATYYQILGVSQTATTDQIKEAFRNKAKQLHPDASQQPSANTKTSTTPPTTEWHAVLLSYQILTESRSRTLYDLSLRRSEPSYIRNAAAASMNVEDDREIDLTWGLDDWLSNKGKHKSDGGEGGGPLDTMRAELQSDFHAALRQAYLGPTLNHLPPGHLPNTFEADERSVTHTPNVVQIVSGRVVLGFVRERRDCMLEESEVDVLRVSGVDVGLLGLPLPDSGTSVVGSFSSGGGGGGGSIEEEAEGERGGGGEGFAQRPLENNSKEEYSTTTHHPHQQQQPNPPEILEIVLDDDDNMPSATAIRYHSHNSNSIHIEVIDNTTDTLLASIRSDESAATASTTTPSTLHIFTPIHKKNNNASTTASNNNNTTNNNFNSGNFDTKNSSTDTTQNKNSTAMQETHIVYRSFSPLVRHLSFLSTATATTTNRRRKLVARCHRAWLPASRLWLFSPVSWEHDIGGWSIEWLGYEKESHPFAMWLDPKVILAVCAFDTLDHEKKGRRPEGVFEEGKKKGGDGGSEGGGGGRWKWVKDILQFHK